MRQHHRTRPVSQAAAPSSRIKGCQVLGGFLPSLVLAEEQVQCPQAGKIWRNREGNIEHHKSLQLVHREQIKKWESSRESGLFGNASP